MHTQNITTSQTNTSTSQNTLLDSDLKINGFTVQRFYIDLQQNNFEKLQEIYNEKTKSFENKEKEFSLSKKEISLLKDSPFLKNEESLMKHFKSKKRSNYKKTIINICFLGGGAGIGTLGGSVVTATIGALIGNNIGGPPMAIAGGIVGGVVGGVIFGSLGYGLGHCAKELTTYSYENYYLFNAKRNNQYKEEFQNLKISNQKLLSIIFKDNEASHIEKQFLCPISKNFIKIPVKHYKRRNPLYELVDIEKVIDESPKDKDYKNSPCKKFHIEKKDLVYDFDYLPKLITKTNDLIENYKIKKPHAKMMFLVLLNLMKYRKVSVFYLQQNVDEQFALNKTIDEDTSDKLKEFLKLEHMSNFKYLQILKENIDEMEEEYDKDELPVQ